MLVFHYLITTCGRIPEGKEKPSLGRGWQGEALTGVGRPSPAWRGWTGEAGTGVEGTPKNIGWARLSGKNLPYA